LRPFVTFVFNFFFKYTANQRGAEGKLRLPADDHQLMINYKHHPLEIVHRLLATDCR